MWRTQSSQRSMFRFKLYPVIRPERSTHSQRPHRVSTQIMIRYNAWSTTAEFTIGRFDHPQDHPHRDPKEEVALDYSVNLVEDGRFTLEIEGRQWEVGRGDLFLTYPGMTYRCRHRELVPRDTCLTVSCVAADKSESTLALHRAARNLPVRRSNSRMDYLFLLFGKVLHEPMAVEETVHEVIVAAACEPDPRQRPYREPQLRWYAERVDAVRLRLERDYAAEHSLSSMARSVGMSVYHFSRIFRELTGTPPHSYLRRTRLRNAAHKLREGASVTEASLASGFQNLSHFTRHFGRYFGATPSFYAAQFRSIRPSQK